MASLSNNAHEILTSTCYWLVTWHSGRTSVCDGVKAGWFIQFMDKRVDGR